MFCPFVKGKCVPDCIFNNTPNDCKLLDSLKSIENNTGTDQTDSWWINSKLGDVLDKLDHIIEKLEQPVD